jgi:hypothetical protein
MEIQRVASRCADVSLKTWQRGRFRVITPGVIQVMDIQAAVSESTPVVAFEGGAESRREGLNKFTLGPSDSLEGKLTYDGHMHVQGRAEGEFRVTGNIDVAAGATVKALLEASSLTVEGEGRGDAHRPRQADPGQDREAERRPARAQAADRGRSHPQRSRPDGGFWVAGDRRLGLRSRRRRTSNPR